jgi:hypothetical protein
MYVNNGPISENSPNVVTLFTADTVVVFHKNVYLRKQLERAARLPIKAVAPWQRCRYFVNPAALKWTRQIGSFSHGSVRSIPCHHFILEFGENDRRDRSYKTPFRPKSFQINLMLRCRAEFHPITTCMILLSIMDNILVFKVL